VLVMLLASTEAFTGLGAHQSNRRLPLGHVADPRSRWISAAPHPCTWLRRSRL